MCLISNLASETREAFPKNPDEKEEELWMNT